MYVPILIDILVTHICWQQAGYAIGGLRGDLKARARASIAGHYAIPGSGMSNQDIRDTVRWLLTKSNFMYGGVNVHVRTHLTSIQVLIQTQERTVDRQEPFMHSIITDIVRAQWFGKGKADVLTMNKMVTHKRILGHVIVLVVTVVCRYICSAQ